MTVTRPQRHPHTGAPLVPVGYRADGRAIWPVLGGDPSEDARNRINELVALGYDQLTDEQIGELRGLVSSEREAINANPDVDVAHIGLVADIAEALNAEDSRRADAAASTAPAATPDDARARLNQAFDPPATPAAPTPAEGAAPAADPAPAAPAGDPAASVPAASTPAAPPATPAAPAATAPPAAAPTPVAEPVAASAPPRPTPLSTVVQAGHRDNDGTPPAVVASLTASAGRANGQTLAGRSLDQQMEDLADGFDQAFRDIRHMRGGVARIPVVASRWQVGATQLRSDNDFSTNRRLMDEAVRAQTLVASGGICRPVTVDYNVPTWSNVEEPVKAALPAIDAPRGGLQYGLPVAYDATVFNAGVGIWSEPNDRNPGGANTGPLSNPTGTGPGTKPCVEIDCGQFTEVDVEAITKCAVVSNFRGRFSPENMNVLMTYLQQAFVAAAEIERLKQMRQACHHASTAAVFGFSRDLLNFYDRLRAYYRSVYRLSDNVPLRIVQNEYVRELIRTDLRKAAFPYEAGPGAPATSLDVTDAEIDAMFASKGLTPVWALDDDTGDQTFAKTTPGTQGSPVAFPGYPAGTAGGSVKVRAMVYPEGSFQRLDGGMLDLGVVRDSALNAENKYQVFSEIFEAVAFRGFEATDWVIDGVPNGASAGTITPA